MKAIIYALIDPLTQEIRYVGKTTNPYRRQWDHRSNCDRNTHKGKWIRKLYETHGVWPEFFVLEEVDCPTGEEWKAEERFWIAYLRCIGCPLTNIDNGGNGVGTATPEMRRRNSERQKGKKLSEEHKRKLSIAGKGKVNSLEAYARAAAKNTGQKRTPEQRARMSSAIRRPAPPLTEEQRMLKTVHILSVRYIQPVGSKHSEETKRKMSEKAKRRTYSEQTRNKMSASAKIRYARTATLNEKGQIQKHLQIA